MPSLTAKRTFRLVHEQAKANAIAAIQRAPINPEKPELVTIEQERKKRSLDQNARYFAILQNASRSSGIDVDDLHDICKRKFLGVREVEFMGAIHELPNSTARLKVPEFIDYCNRAEMYLVEEGLVQIW